MATRPMLKLFFYFASDKSPEPDGKDDQHSNLEKREFYFVNL
jgi:hypothetical protein